MVLCLSRSVTTTEMGYLGMMFKIVKKSINNIMFYSFADTSPYRLFDDVHVHVPTKMKVASMQ